MKYQNNAFKNNCHGFRIFKVRPWTLQEAFASKIPDSRHFKGQDRTYPNFKKNNKKIFVGRLL